MRIRVLGGGWYGCHISTGLLKSGHDVELHEIADGLFAGASGACPARLHQGFHYPRSRLTRVACQEHAQEFIGLYGHLTRGVPVNIYAVAEHDSLVDFGTYCQVLESEFIRIADPSEYGLEHVEGAVLTGERHICIAEVVKHFEKALDGHIRYNSPPTLKGDWDVTIDCTFCANDSENIDRYEPCIMGLLELPERRAVTIMDGPFPSVYPWDDGTYHSITSASLTPLSKTCRTWGEARKILDSFDDRIGRVRQMVEQMAYYWPVVESAQIVAAVPSIRAMPRSGSDARLVDVVRVNKKTLRVRAGKIDAIMQAERIVREML